jgi:hypothetical protein
VGGWPSPIGNRTTFRDVLIADNHIEGVDRCGIIVWTPSGPCFQEPIKKLGLPFTWKDLLPSTGVIVRNNTLEDIGGDVILVLGSTAPLIEGNIADHVCMRSGLIQNYPPPANAFSAAIWVHSCDRAIMQHNCVSRILSQPANGDATAYDFDYNCTNCILQVQHQHGEPGRLHADHGESPEQHRPL